MCVEELLVSKLLSICQPHTHMQQLSFFLEAKGPEVITNGDKLRLSGPLGEE